MKTQGYPFAAIVAQPDLKLALLLAAVDWRLSVLLEGDKGSGKSTAARALAELLPAGAPFINLPIGTTEDRLLGSLDLSEALQGTARLKQGLIQQAHRGVLYIDEVNLLADALTDALLDVASSGRHYVERDGFSASSESNFILLGSMNQEEGVLRPQLRDRFALSVSVQAPLDAAARAQIVTSRIQFDTDPAAFRAAWETEQNRLRKRIANARSSLQRIECSPEILPAVSEAVIDCGVRSLRADLAILRAATAHAALNERGEVAWDDIESVLPLVLHHRAQKTPPAPPPPPSTSKPREDPKVNAQDNSAERIFAPLPQQAPVVRSRFSPAVEPGKGSNPQERSKDDSGESLHVVASLTQSFRNTGQASLRSEDLVFRSPNKKPGHRFIFVVDASGSHAAHQRMAAVKGAAVALLQSSVNRQDEVAVISFRGPQAEVVLPPCADSAAAARVLEFLPTGGRTPLAHALQLAGSLVTRTSLLVLVTDGRANVPLTTTDPWSDALHAAQQLDCPCLLVDSSLNATNAEAMDALASSLRAQRIPLDHLSSLRMLELIQ